MYPRKLLEPPPLPSPREREIELTPKTRKDAQLDGKYLSVFDNVVGIFPGRQTLFVTASESSKKGCVELHLHPTGIIDHALGLVGEGVKELHDIANPASSPGADWTSFAMNSAGDPGEPNLGSLSYTAKGGRWVVFPAKAGGEWKVTWLDGKFPFPLPSFSSPSRLWWDRDKID